MDLSIVIRKTKGKICDTLSSSGLSYDVMDYILQDIQQTVHGKAEEYYQQAIAAEKTREEAAKRELEQGEKEQDTGESRTKVAGALNGADGAAVGEEDI